MDAQVRKHGGEILRSLRNHKYEQMENGDLFMPEQKLVFAGRFNHMVNGQDEQFDKNIIVTEGLNYILDAALHAATQLSTWYIGLFAGNVTPVNTWTAANVTANSTEFVTYTQAARVEFVETGAAAGSLNNTGSLAQFTMDTGGPFTLYGAFMASASAKSATTGKLLAAARFANPRTGMASPDVLSVGYTLTATST